MKYAAVWLVLLGCAASSCGGRGDVGGGRGDEAFSGLPDGGVYENEFDEDDEPGSGGGGPASGGKPSPGSGGSPGVGGGNSGTGGRASAGGASSIGGSPQSGGASSIGGSPPRGGASSIGGSPPRGGASSIGGSPSGGASSIGGSPPRGGAAAGGTPAGGAGGATGGAAAGGAGGAPPECKVDSISNFGYCSLQTFCENPNAYYSTNCSDNGDGNVWCSCETPAGNRTLLVSDLAARDACAPVQDECRNPTPIDDTPKCGIVTQGVNVDSCSLEQECEQSVTRGGVTFRSVQRNGTTCYHDGTDWVCDCYGDRQSVPQGARLDGTFSNQGVCAVSLSICENGVPEPTGPRTCTLQQFFGSRDDCNIQQECTQQGKTPGGTVVFSRESELAQCFRGFDPIGEPPLVPPPADAWYCDCQNGKSVGEFFGTDSFTVCQAAATACSE